MKVLLVMATWLCCAIIVFPALVTPSSSTTEQQQTGTNTLRYNTVTFDLAQSDTYSKFIADLQTELFSGTTACQIPVTRATATTSNDQRFVLVDLETPSQKTITLAIDVTDVYVVAYRDKFKEKDGQMKDRANFLQDASTVAKENLFHGATVRNLAFKGTYTSLENAANQRREAIELGVDKLEFAIESVYGKTSTSQRNEAKFLLIAIQMVSEAARFKYIESKVNQSALDYESFLPDPKMLLLETNWGKISQEIHESAGAKPACMNLSPPIPLKKPNGDPWTVDKVDTIRPEMGILKFKDAKLVIRIVSYFTRLIVGENEALFVN